MKKNAEFFVLVTEHDTDDPFKSHGAILMETYTRSASLEEAIERAEQVGEKYGKAYVFRCTMIGTAEVARAVMQERERIRF